MDSELVWSIPMSNRWAMGSKYHTQSLKAQKLQLIYPKVLIFVRKNSESVFFLKITWLSLLIARRPIDDMESQVCFWEKKQYPKAILQHTKGMLLSIQHRSIPKIFTFRVCFWQKHCVCQFSEERTNCVINTKTQKFDVQRPKLKLVEQKARRVFFFF